MSSAHRVLRQSFLFAFYVSVLLNAPLLAQNTTFDQYQSVLSTLLAVVGLCSATTLLLLMSSALGKYFYRLFGSFVVLSSVAAAFYMIQYKVVIGYGIIASVLTTDTDLHGEQFGWKFIFWMLVLGGLPVWYLWLKPLPQLFLWKGTKRLQSVWIVVLSILAVLSFRGFDWLERAQAKQENAFAPSPSGRVAHTYLPSNWLSALGLFAYERYKSHDSVLKDPAKMFRYQTEDWSDTYVVFVIGETTRADHMSIFGYERLTTPRLQNEPNLFAFKGVSFDTATKLSLKCMFVCPQGVANNEQRTLSEKNVFSVLRDLGLSSELFALQSEVWFYQSAHANDIWIREMLAAQPSAKNRRIDDMLLVDSLRSSLQNRAQERHLVILHTKGSHYLYSERYPEQFAQFKPECKSIDQSCTKQQLVNSDLPSN